MIFYIPVPVLPVLPGPGHYQLLLISRDSLSVLSRVSAASVPVMPRVPGHVSADTLLRYRRCVQELQVPLKLISGVYVQQYFQKPPFLLLLGHSFLVAARLQKFYSP